jgi:hypothetical protein
MCLLLQTPAGGKSCNPFNLQLVRCGERALRHVLRRLRSVFRETTPANRSPSRMFKVEGQKCATR